MTACLKALLASPINEQGVSTLFGLSDFSQLRGKGKFRPHAITASDYMMKTSNFLCAYGAKLEPHERAKLQNDLEVRLVMHVHNKKSPSRASYASQLEIVAATYEAAQALLKPRGHPLPAWPLIADASLQNKVTASDAPKMVTVDEDGTVPDSMMVGFGMRIGSIVTDDGDKTVFKITHIDGQKVTLQQ